MRSERAETSFCISKRIVSPDKNIKSSLEVFQLSRETSGSPCQCRNIMAQISIHTFYRKRIIFVVNIEDMLTGKDHIQIAIIPICTVLLRFRGRIHHLLYGLGGFVHTYHMSYNLSGFSARHDHDIDIFLGFRVGLTLQEPV